MLKFTVDKEQWNGADVLTVHCEEAAVEFRGGMATTKGQTSRVFTRGENIWVRFLREGQSPTEWLLVHKATHETAAIPVRGHFERGV